MSIYIFIKKKSEYKTVTFSSGEIRPKSYKIRNSQVKNTWSS
jgi:hypothetical protein